MNQPLHQKTAIDRALAKLAAPRQVRQACVELGACEPDGGASARSFANVENVLATLQLKLGKLHSRDTATEGLVSSIKNQLKLELNQTIIGRNLARPPVLDGVDIFTRLSTVGDVRLRGHYATQSGVTNGHCYQKLPTLFVNAVSATRQTDQVLALFGQFQRVQPNMYYCMRLQVQANRIGYSLIHHDFIYVFSDAPNGRYFLQKKQADAFRDFDVLVDAHVQETQKAYARLPDSEPARAELFSSAFWEPQLTRLSIKKIISLVERDYGGLASALDIHVNNGECLSLVFACFYELRDFVEKILSQSPRLLRFLSSYVYADDGYQIPLRQPAKSSPMRIA